jgi:hypothetical protein
MRFIGIDENGYGPVLGPMVVTSASLKLHSRKVPDLWQLLGIRKNPENNLKELLVCDSKMVFNTSRKRELAAEETVLAFFYLCFGFLPESADQFLRAVIDPSTTTYNPSCFCWKKDIDLGLNPERRQRILKSAEKLKKRADRKGVAIDKPCCFLFCPSLFNEGLKSRNKSGLVLEAGLNLVRQHVSDGQFFACLGRVGGIRYYRDHISAFFGLKFTVTPVREEKDNSAYELSKAGAAVGTITYLQDGEENSFLIALSSLFGKYTRDLFWKKTRTYLEELSPPPRLPRRGGGVSFSGIIPPGGGAQKTKFLPPQRGGNFPLILPPGGGGKVGGYSASGYRDLLTKRFIKETEGLRKKLGIPDDCFLRRK